MRVKILQNSQGPLCWYDGRIGEVFESSEFFHLGMNTGDFETIDPAANKPGLIAYEDGEVLADKLEDGKCPHCGHPVAA